MSIIKKYIEEGGGNFLTVKNCPIGATMTIKGVTRDDETFDKSYIVLNGIYDLSGEECNARLGVQNVERVAEVLSDDETKWLGQKIQCIVHQSYPGLGQKGILWQGVAEGAAPAVIPAAPATEQVSQVPVIIGKIMVANPELTAKAVKKLIDKEIKKAEGLLTEDAAAVVVAGTLGVDLK